MNPAIFRLNDLRGIYQQDFSADDFTLIGQAFAKYLFDRGTRSCVIGHDNRLQSGPLSQKLVDGLVRSGVNVTDLGQVATPQLYFARLQLKIDGGVMVTASHNDPAKQWYGAKLCQGGGAIHEQEITEVKNNLLLKKFITGTGQVSTFDITPSYLTNLRAKANLARIKSQLKIRRVGIDTGNGMGGVLLPRLLREVGLQVEELYTTPDSNFPHHSPNPSDPANLVELQQLVTSKQLDLGLAYDGDVDRLNVVGPTGQILGGDGLTILFARDLLSRVPESLIYYDIMCSPAVPDEIARLHGRSMMLPSGHSIIAHFMHKTNAAMAGEYSGHMYFNEGYDGFDDGIYATFRLLGILAHYNWDLEQELAKSPHYFGSGQISIAVPEGKQAEVIDELYHKLQDQYFTDLLGGLRIKIGESWAAVHASNTESLIRLAVWSRYQDDLDKTTSYLQNLIRTAI